MRNWSLDIALLTLIALIGVAVWQFHSLTRGDSPSGSYAAGLRQEQTIQGTVAARPLPK